MKYAVIRTGGKQYKVTEGDIIEVERVTTTPGSTITFGDVLLYASDDDVKIGQPLLADLLVKGKVLDHIRGEKIRVAKFKAKARYRRVTGHRQALSKIQIDQVGDTPVKKEKKEEQKIEKHAAMVTADQARVVKKSTRKTATKKV